ncbi:uncharacterized protein LOC108988642 [Juglans regia]|uniref:Uncharacterized protein LOC108988642 n=1 Tax=Juglans regia TaxID=51240 RepID=A0A6P9E8M2_JUGRE|nr:uncharacterized protein LOC108988642 [Juglans regia]
MQKKKGKGGQIWIKKGEKRGEDGKPNTADKDSEPLVETEGEDLEGNEWQLVSCNDNRVDDAPSKEAVPTTVKQSLCMGHAKPSGESLQNLSMQNNAQKQKRPERESQQGRQEAEHQQGEQDDELKQGLERLVNLRGLSEGEQKQLCSHENEETHHTQQLQQVHERDLRTEGMAKSMLSVEGDLYETGLSHEGGRKVETVTHPLQEKVPHEVTAPLWSTMHDVSLAEQENSKIMGFFSTETHGLDGLVSETHGLDGLDAGATKETHGLERENHGLDGLVGGKMLFFNMEESQSDYEVERDNLHEDSQKDYSSESGKIWLLWNSEVSVQKLASSNQLLTVKVEENGHGFILTVVYAKCNHNERKSLWEDLEDTASFSLPWIICGDFNIIKDDSERRGRQPRQFTAMADFNLCIQNCGLVDMRFQGPSFGSHNLGPFSLGDSNRRKSFQTTTIIHELEQRIDRLESSLQNCFNTEDDNDLMVSKFELSTWMSREETRLSHLAKKNWLKDGDQNSKFFHAILNVKKHNRVSDMFLVDGTHINSPVKIHQAAVDYFKEFLGHHNSCDMSDLNHLISPVISNEENLMLCKDHSIDDIKDALFSIPIDSSSGPNGFGSGFFRTCWEFVKEDLLEATLEFFHSHHLPRYFTASYIVLIPKVDKPNGFDKFRPISLCSVFYKICTKIIVARLTNLLAKMIAQEQGAFIPGRSIFENISLTPEMVHSINKKSVGGNVVIKLDMSKAYDRVDWKFLLHVLDAFGFSAQFCDLIKACISTPWYSIMMNGTPKGFFKSERGLRQGDPLSPYLFIILQEVLSRLLKQAFDCGLINLFSQARSTPLVSHLMYADDIGSLLMVVKSL